MAYSGKFQPKNPRKYKGDPRLVIYRSLWELKFMKWCDDHDHVLEWGSEEIVVPYRSPLDGRIHRYFVDFYIKIQNKNNTIKKYLIEVKPKKQTKPPKKKQRVTKSYIFECKTWEVNKAKWKAAVEFCEDRRIEFKIITEDELGIK